MAFLVCIIYLHSITIEKLVEQLFFSMSDGQIIIRSGQLNGSQKCQGIARKIILRYKSQIVNYKN